MHWEKPLVRTLPDQVAHAIIEQIATGRLRPGDTLPTQRELARVVHVGLSAVREAVQRLQMLHVLDSRRGIGTVVRRFRWMQLMFEPSLFPAAVEHLGSRDLWEVRHVLEREIARLAALRAQDSDRVALREVLERARPIPRSYDYHMQLNRDFHLALAHAAHNAVLEDLLAPLLDIRWASTASRFDEARSRRSWVAHQRIYEALIARDARRVEAAMDAHLRVGLRVLAAMAARPARR